MKLTVFKVTQILIHISSLYSMSAFQSTECVDFHLLHIVINMYAHEYILSI